MARAWKCTCGASFPKYGFAFTTHIKEGGEKGEQHGSVGLVDAETGEVLARTLPEAVQMGLCRPRRRGTEALRLLRGTVQKGLRQGVQKALRRTAQKRFFRRMRRGSEALLRCAASSTHRKCCWTGGSSCSRT